MRRVWVAVVLCVAAAGCAGDSPEAGEQDSTHLAPRLELPYDLAIDAEGRIYVTDGLLHQVLRHDRATGETVVVAGTGEAGSTGDGGPASEATLEEPLGLAFDPDGNLYVVDFVANRIRRVDRGGTITTVTDELDLPAAAAVDPAGRYLAVPTLGNYVYRVALETGRVETVAGDGTPQVTGDCGPAAAARVESPHGIAYDEEGHLYFPDGQGVIRRIDAETGVITTVAEGPQVQAFKILVAADGSIYLATGDPSGGDIRRLGPDGTIDILVGTGILGRSGDGLPATEIGILPSDVAIAPDGALIFSQTEPDPAVRGVDPETGIVTTLFR